MLHYKPILKTNIFLYISIVLLNFVFVRLASATDQKIIPDDDICASFHKLGSFTNIDLDDLHLKLAKEENNITKELIERGSNKTNNVAIATITLWLEHKDGSSETKIFPVGLPSKVLEENHESIRRKVFESAFTLNATKGRKLNTRYNFDSKLIEIPDLLSHINSIWGKETNKKASWEPKDDLTDWEKRKIWEQFIKFQEKIVPSNDKLKKEVTSAALCINSFPSLAPFINNFAFLLDKEEKNSKSKDYSFNQAEIVKGNIFRGTIDNDIDLLLERSKILTTTLESFQTSLNSTRQEITKLYNYFWHSEQRLIHFLVSNQSRTYWEEIKEYLTDFEDLPSIKGAILHIHSRNNFCQTCRHSLVRVCHKGDGILYNKLQEQFRKWNITPKNSFFLKICGSFRVMYKASLPNDKSIYWMSYNVRLQSFKDAGFYIKQPLILKRVLLNSWDEKENYESYVQHLCDKALEEKAKKETIENIFEFFDNHEIIFY